MTLEELLAPQELKIAFNLLPAADRLLLNPAEAESRDLPAAGPVAQRASGP
jgi:hypothetical protein